jgi:hypothetical protein
MIYRVLTVIQAGLGNGASESALKQGALSNNDVAFERLLGLRGVLVRTECVERRAGPPVRYLLTERGKQFQEKLLWGIEMDNYTGGEFYAK